MFNGDTSEDHIPVNKPFRGVAFEALYHQYVGLVYKYVYIHIRNKDTTQDIVQEVFFKVWKALSSYKGDDERTFRAWLLRIAHNTLLDTVRKLKREKTNIVPDANIETFGTNDGHARLNELLELMDNLSPDQKQALVLKYVDGLKNDEIAKVMDKKPGTIRVIHMRGLEKLREHIREAEGQ